MHQGVALPNNLHHLIPGPFNSCPRRVHGEVEPRGCKQELDTGDFISDRGCVGSDGEEADVRAAFRGGRQGIERRKGSKVWHCQVCVGPMKRIE